MSRRFPQMRQRGYKQIFEIVIETEFYFFALGIVAENLFVSIFLRNKKFGSEKPDPIFHRGTPK